MSKNIPLYGQNKDGGGLGALTSLVRMRKISIAVASSGNADNAIMEYLPAYAAPIFSVAVNSGDVALAGNACVLDIPDIGATCHVTGELNALAAGDMVTFVVDSDANVLESNTGSEEIRIDGGSGLVTASGTTTIDVYLYYLDGKSLSVDAPGSEI